MSQGGRGTPPDAQGEGARRRRGWVLLRGRSWSKVGVIRVETQMISVGRGPWYRIMLVRNALIDILRCLAALVFGTNTYSEQIAWHDDVDSRPL
eukprot:748670-Hanusia_phi.AAC.3